MEQLISIAGKTYVPAKNSDIYFHFFYSRNIEILVKKVKNNSCILSSSKKRKN
jgi:hypothetical protein